METLAWRIRKHGCLTAQIPLNKRLCLWYKYRLGYIVLYRHTTSYMRGFPMAPY